MASCLVSIYSYFFRRLEFDRFLIRDTEAVVARPRAFNETDAVRLASRAFWSRGYQATAVRDLEQATGLTAGSLYKAYGSKRELFQLCVEQYMKEDSYLALLLRMFEHPAGGVDAQDL